MMFIILIIAVIYLFSESIILNSVKSIFNSPKADFKPRLKFSVIVAAKNEEKNLPYLIDALKKQNYPENLFEVIIVDDNSKDNTFEIGAELISGLNHFSIYKVSDKKYPGKKGALQYGIEKAVNPFILITDADCQPEIKWINAFSNKFEIGNDFLLGAAPFSETKSLINRIACFENLRAHLLTFTAAKSNLPYSAAARSFGFRKKSFEKIKSYSNTLETLSGDDDLLLREAVKHKMRIGIVAEGNSLVISETPDSFRDYLKQKARHTSTSIHYKLTHKIFLGVWHLINLVMLLSPILIFIDNKFLILFLLKLFGDINLVVSTKKFFNYKFNLFEIIFYQIIYEILIVVNFFNSFFRKVEWK